MTYEGLRLKVSKIIRIKLSKQRARKLNRRSFTIISNNCWGGMIYESYGLIKQSPTVGLFFMADDYIKFIKNLKSNVSAELRFIPPEKSKWYSEVRSDPRYGSYPVGILNNDIEIFFLHYHSEEEAESKWRRRCERINWSNLIIKFNDQNGCTRENVLDFLSTDFSNKLFFTVKNWSIDDTNTIIKIKQPFEKKHILASYEPFGKSRYIDVTRYINSISEGNA